MRLAEPERRGTELKFRTGRASAWIEEAPAPLRGRMPEPELRQLVLAIRCAVGIEALVWLTDIAGLARGGSRLSCANYGALLQAALADQAAVDNSAA